MRNLIRNGNGDLISARHSGNSEFQDFSNELGFMEPKIENMANLIAKVMICLGEIDSLRKRLSVLEDNHEPVESR